MKLHVGVFFGGKATEHEVSVISAIQAIENMDKDKYEIIPIYIAKDETFYTGDALLDIKNYKDMTALLNSCSQCGFEKCKGEEKVELLKVPSKLFSKKLGYFELAFPILHGNKGENGGVQGLLEMLSIPYVGSNVLASGISMDKDISKIVATSVGIPVIDFVAVDKYAYYKKSEDVLTQILQKLVFPMIIKPAGGGSSIGIEVAKNSQQLRAAIEQAFNYDVKLIIENKVDNIREVNCSVLGDIEQAKASVIEEPSTADEILSFNDKYMQNSTKGMSSAKRQIPADIDAKMQKDIEDYSIAIFQKYGCSGVVRIDYIIDTDKNQVYFNEINPIPGSLSFYLWEPSGLKYKQLLDELIRLGIKRHQRNNEFNYSFENNLFASNSLGMKGKLKGGSNG
ncbi:D-alanine--D-alanine ligase [Vallitaleaceae bacterium 9-2]